MPLLSLFIVVSIHCISSTWSGPLAHQLAHSTMWLRAVRSMRTSSRTTIVRGRFRFAPNEPPVSSPSAGAKLRYFSTAAVASVAIGSVGFAAASIVDFERALESTRRTATCAWCRGLVRRELQTADELRVRSNWMDPDWMRQQMDRWIGATRPSRDTVDDVGLFELIRREYDGLSRGHRAAVWIIGSYVVVFAAMTRARARSTLCALARVRLALTLFPALLRFVQYPLSSPPSSLFVRYATTVVLLRAHHQRMLQLCTLAHGSPLHLGLNALFAYK
jgi:hypothetical protein